MEEKVKAKKPIFKKWWFWVIVVIVIAGIIGGGGNDDAQKANAPGVENQESQNDESQSNNDNEQVKEDSEENKKIITEVGQSVTTKNFIVTLEAVNKSEGSDYNKPADGKEFTELILVIENISDKDYSVSSIMMFNAYEDSFSINESLSAHITSDIPTMDGTLAAGKKLRGKLAYELSTEWKELEIDIDLTALSLVSTDGEIKIVLQNQ